MSLVHLSALCSHLQNASRARLSLTSFPHTKLHLAVAQQLQRSGFISTVTIGGPEPPPESPLLAHPPTPPLERQQPPWREPVPNVTEFIREGKVVTNSEWAADHGAGAQRAEDAAPADLDIRKLWTDILEDESSSAPSSSSTDPSTSSSSPQSLDAQIERLAELIRHSDANVAHVSHTLASDPRAVAALPPHVLTALAPHEAQPTRRTIVPPNPAQRRLWLGLKYWQNRPVLEKVSMVSKPTRRIWFGAEDLGRLARGRRVGYVEGLRQIGECLFVSTDRGVMEVRECMQRGVGGMLLCRAV